MEDIFNKIADITKPQKKEIMYTYIIYSDKKEIKRFEDQNSDINIFKFMLNCQGNSMDYAFKYGGYSATVTDQDTKEIVNYN